MRRVVKPPPPPQAQETKRQARQGLRGVGAVLGGWSGSGSKEGALDVSQLAAEEARPPDFPPVIDADFPHN